MTDTSNQQIQDGLRRSVRAAFDGAVTGSPTMTDTPEPTTTHGRYVLTISRLHSFPAFDVTDITQIEDEARAEGPLLWWCPAWGTLNATRYHGNDGPDDPNCGKVAYRRAVLAEEPHDD